MKILYIIQRYHPAGGGAEISIKIQAEYIASRPGYQVDLWTSNALDIDALWDVNKAKVKEKSEVVNKVNVKRFRVAPLLFSNNLVNKGLRFILRRLPSWDSKTLSTPPTVFGMLWRALTDRTARYDVIHVTSSPYYILFYIALKLAKRTGAKLVISPKIHMGHKKGDLTYQTYFKKESVRFYQEADKIIVQTYAARNVIIEFAKEHGVDLPEGKFVKSTMGIYPSELKGGDGARFREKYEIPEDMPIVFYIGAKVSGKGAFNLIRAMEKFWADGGKARLVMAGSHTVEFDKFWERVSPETKKKVSLLGFIDEQDKLDLLDAGDVFSMVSRSDSFGISYLEAWFYGKPVLGCDNKIMREVIDDKVDGYLVPFDDLDGIAEKIKYLLDNSDVARKLGKAGQEKVMKKYKWEDQLKIIDDTYKSLVAD
ncbi:glycosyltransferase [Candidatus Dojkabacteria bacterium]|nr:glycosyltransferase [Candidatus Dojkabacteria bacterium]